MEEENENVGYGNANRGMDYSVAQEELMDILDWKCPPVAVKLIRHEALIPGEVKELKKPMFYCTMVKYAMLGNVFYARVI